MTEQELREKIVKIIDKVFDDFASDAISDVVGYIADALIATGLTFDKTMAVLAERKNCKTLIQKAQYYDQMKHRAEVAELALLTACAKMVKDEKDDVNIELLVGVIYRKYLKQAEKELAEEKHEQD